MRSEEGVALERGYTELSEVHCSGMRVWCTGVKDAFQMCTVHACMVNQSDLPRNVGDCFLLCADHPWSSNSAR